MSSENTTPASSSPPQQQQESSPTDTNLTTPPASSVETLHSEINTLLRHNGFKPLDQSSYSVSSVLLDVLKSYERRGKVLELSRQKNQNVENRNLEYTGFQGESSEQQQQNVKNQESTATQDSENNVLTHSESSSASQTDTDSSIGILLFSKQDAIPPLQALYHNSAKNSPLPVSTPVEHDTRDQKTTTSTDSLQKQTIQVLKEHVERLEEKIDQMQLRNEEQETENRALKEKIQSLLDKMEQSKQKANLHIQNLQKNSSNTPDSPAALNTSVEELQEDLSSFILTHDDEHQILEEDIRHYKEEISYLNNELKKLGTRNLENNHTQEIEMLRMQLKVFRDKEIKYQERIKQMREEFESAQEHYQSRVEESSAHVEKLVMELEDMKGRLEVVSTQESQTTTDDAGMTLRECMHRARVSTPEELLLRLDRLQQAVQALPKMQKFIVDICNTIQEGKKLLGEEATKVPPRLVLDQINAWIFMLTNAESGFNSGSIQQKVES